MDKQTISALRKLGIKPDDKNIKQKLSDVATNGQIVIFNDDGREESRVYALEAAVRKTYADYGLQEPLITMVLPIGHMSAQGPAVSEDKKGLLSSVNQETRYGLGKNTVLLTYTGKPADGVYVVNNSTFCNHIKRVSMALSGPNNTHNYCNYGGDQIDRPLQSGTIANLYVAYESGGKFNSNTLSISISDSKSNALNDTISGGNAALVSNLESCIVHAVRVSNDVVLSKTILTYHVPGGNQPTDTNVIGIKDSPSPSSNVMTVQAINNGRQSVMINPLGLQKPVVIYQNNNDVLKQMQDIQKNNLVTKSEADLILLKSAIFKQQVKLEDLKRNLSHSSKKSDRLILKSEIKQTDAVIKEMNNLIAEKKEAVSLEQSRVSETLTKSGDKFSKQQNDGHQVPRSIVTQQGQSLDSLSNSQQNQTKKLYMLYEPVSRDQASFVYPDAAKHGRIASELFKQKSSPDLTKKFNELFDKNNPDRATVKDFNDLFRNPNKTTNSMLNSPYHPDIPKPERLAAVINYAFDVNSDKSIYFAMDFITRKTFDDFAKDAIERIGNLNRSQGKPVHEGLSSEVLKKYVDKSREI